MKNNIEIVQVDIRDLKPSEYNPRQAGKKECDNLKESIKRFGLVDPIIVNSAESRKNIIIGGHFRLRMAQEMGYKVVPVVYVDIPNLKKEQELNLRLNKNTGSWDFDLLANIEEELLLDVGFESIELEKMFGIDDKPEDDDVPESKETDIKAGDIFQLGSHRVLCGDATKREDVERLMGEDRADMLFCDPPYGINKDIENDNLNQEKLVAFNGEWINNTTGFIKDCGYIFIWGYFQVLAETWVKVIKPLDKVGFRNFIIWKKKGNVQGINTAGFRMFPPSYEACLMFVYGQQFGNGAWSSTTNSEFYWEGYDPIRLYLNEERKKMGWDIKTVKAMFGHSVLSRDHWFVKSQWSMITKELYLILQREANNRAFRKQYDELRKQYDELRGYFNNTNGFADIWEFEEMTVDKNHPTVKPVELCQRAIISTTKVNELVLDPFCGSGSALIACEKLSRKCLAIEIDPQYVSVIVTRYCKFVGNNKVVKNGQEIVWEM
ncbi:DNA modification methylase [Patescibacteria group bacterium]|nr:DNA modification methylase [Patescibacteria group bacterium]